MTQYGKGEWIENMEGDFEWSPAEEVRTMTREPLPFKDLKENKEIINQIANKCDDEEFDEGDVDSAVDMIDTESGGK